MVRIGAGVREGVEIVLAAGRGAEEIGRIQLLGRGRIGRLVLAAGLDQDHAGEHEKAEWASQHEGLRSFPLSAAATRS